MKPDATFQPETYLHIGYHRTATTYLQRLFFPMLPAAAIISPDVRSLAEGPVFDPVTFRDSLGLRNSFGPKDRPPKIIISQEAFSGKAAGGPRLDPFRIASRIKQAFPTGRVLMVIRNQSEYILSLYCFSTVRDGMETRALGQYLDDCFETGLRQKLEYDRLISHYFKLFGRERVLVIPYLRLVENHEAFLQEILDFMELSAPLPRNIRVNSATRVASVVRINALLNRQFKGAWDGMSRRGVISHARYRTLSKRYFRLKDKFLTPLLEKLAGETPPLVSIPAEWSARLAQAFRDSNRKVVRMTDWDLSKYGWPC